MTLLRLLVVLQLAVGAIGLATVDPDEKSESVGAGAPTTTTAAQGATTTAAPNATTSTTARAGGGTTVPTTTTAAPRATSTTATTRPATQGLTPAKAGKYDYRITYTDDEGSESTEGSYSLSTAKEQDGEIRQFELEVDGETTTTTHYAWRADGLYVRTVTNDDSTCNFEPDLKAVASPPNVGQSWRIDTSCTEDGETISLTGTWRIARTERITIAGRQLDTVVIETTVNTDEGDFTGRQHFSVPHGLIVRDETTYDDGSSEVQELLNVDPK